MRTRPAAIAVLLAGSIGAFTWLSVIAGDHDAGAAPRAERTRRRHRHAAADAGVGEGGASIATAARSHDPGCLYGRVLDGHSGQVRCLSPEELTPPNPYDTPPPPATETLAEDAGVGSVVTDAGPQHPTEVRVASLEFEGGEVPHAEAVLNKLAAKEFAACASEHGGSRRDGEMEIRFLVRAPGRAEGIDVGKSKGVPGEVGRCIVAALAGKRVGAPSTEPVGITLTLTLTQRAALAPSN